MGAVQPAVSPEATPQRVLALWDPVVVNDPYPLYADLREAGSGVHPSPQGWVVTRYHDLAEVLRHEQAGHGEPQLDPSLSRQEQATLRMFIQRDPPFHTALRTMVRGAFTPRTVERLRTSVHRLTEAFVEQIRGGGTVDLVDTFAAPLPIAVISDMLAIPDGDRADFRRWSEALVLPVDETDDPRREERIRNGDEFLAYLDALVVERRHNPLPDDLVSDLVRSFDASPVTDDEDLVATLLLLLFAGHETTVNLLGTGTFVLLQHPVAAERLRSDPDAVRPAVEELLRYDGPVHFTGRVALADLVVGDVEVAAGERLVLMLGSGNRDQRRFADADRFDIDRPDSGQHLGFGVGAHFCLGAALARLETQVALPYLLRELPDLEVVAPPRWRDSLMLRGMSEFLVRA